MSKAQHNVYVNNIFDAEDIQRVNVVDKSINDSLSSAPDKDTAISNTIIMESTPNDEANQSDNPIHNKQALLRPLLIILVCILVTAVITYFATKNSFSENENTHDTECSTACGNSGTIYSQACFRESCAGDGEQIDMRFSRTGLYYLFYMSDDDKTLSNVKTAETSRSSSARFSKNKGTISDYTLDINELIYYEVNYTFTLHDSDNIFGWEILQVGITECSNVDTYFSLNILNEEKNQTGWFVYMWFHRFWLSQVRLSHYQNGTFITYGIIYEDHTIIGRKIQGQLKVFINTRRSEFTVVHNNDSPLYIFKEVKSNETLCPTFGVFDPKNVDVQLKILNSRNFSRYPW